MAGAEVTRRGVLQATISEDLAQHESKTTYSLRSGETVTPLLPTAPVPASSGDAVEATGTMHEGQLVGQVTALPDLTPAATPAEPRKVAVLLMRFPKDGAQPWPPSQARSEVFTGEKSANAFFKEESWGQVSLVGKNSAQGDVFGWYTVDPSVGCPYETWDAEARAAAESDGVSLAEYDHVIYMSTFNLACKWFGVASLGGKKLNINGTFGGPETIAHELGHNLGMRHAGSWSCTKGAARVPVSDSESSCTTAEYGDPFDVQGNSSMRHSSAWNLRLFDVVSLSDDSIETVTEGGTYALQSTLNPNPTPHVLRIARADSPPGGPLDWYYLEVRQQGGIFENFNDATMSGVSIRIVSEGEFAETRLIDNQPATAGFADAPLPVGRTFSDGHVHVTVLSAAAGSASVAVGFDPYQDKDPPSPPTNFSAVQLGGDVRLLWSAGADNVGISGYAVFRDGSEIGTTPKASFTDLGPSLGTHVYTVYSEDEAGNLSEASAPKLVTLADTESPTAPAGLTAALDGASVALHWEPSSDNVGVFGYGILRDGVAVGATPAAAFTDQSAPPGQHTYVVYAQDAAGNRGPVSEPRTVTVPDLRPPPPPEGGEEKLAKPALSWKRLPNGAFALVVDARRDPHALRVELWLDGDLLGSKKGRVLQVTWRPAGALCDHVYRLRARAVGQTAAGQTITATRNRSLRLPGRAGRCRREDSTAPTRTP